MELNEIIKQILGKDISWFDYSKLERGEWSRYAEDARLISGNETFKNELNHYIADLTKFCATMNGTPLSQDKLIILTNVQFGIVVLETFKKRLETIINPKDSEVLTSPFEEI